MDHLVGGPMHNGNWCSDITYLLVVSEDVGIIPDPTNHFAEGHAPTTFDRTLEEHAGDVEGGVPRAGNGARGEVDGGPGADGAAEDDDGLRADPFLVGEVLPGRVHTPDAALLAGILPLESS
eukprot:CAMPEP_0206579304 /NCGR_PEP_ID=MMETSP0325_2-20121206/32476_1 /ASSEMBLY_ACC=CAM_ASM_000347 /TAXON_ID=2866 /ORGANISM="Crypthecodinium cohnii, Strain Seligo" /LENGTH=121 /DNA_ID=CAMNT_0054085103 /DNA_START=363 /DNA_END=728 /DNA_ORIENTATION=-